MNLHVVMPAHNEQHRIGRTLSAYRRDIPSSDLRITVALDDCTDATADIVMAHAAQDTRIDAVHFPRLGKGGVLAEAFRRTDSALVAFVDADCATPPAELLVLARTVAETGADLAVASRWHPSSLLPRPRPLERRIASAGFARAVRALFHLPYRDTQCGAKVLTRAAGERIIPLLSSRDFLFDVDLLVTARALGLRVAEVPTVWIDRDGSRVRPVHDSVRMAASLGRLWLHHHVVPVQLPSRQAAGDAVIDLRTVQAPSVPATEPANRASGVLNAS